MFRIWDRTLFHTLLVGFKLEGCAVGVSAVELYVAEHHIHVSSRCPVEDGGASRIRGCFCDFRVGG